ncbi:MAG: hypothetical protein ACP5J8_02585, partial [Minisyncoccia bacterium]
SVLGLERGNFWSGYVATYTNQRGISVYDLYPGGYNCYQWTYGSSGYTAGDFGDDSKAFDTNWVDLGGDTCDTKYYLLCYAY